MNCPEIPVADKLAYPPIQVTEPNQRYAAILLQDLSAVRGEITAVHQYVYHHWVIHDADPKLANLFSRIARVEMHHMNILGELIIKLGGNPVARTNPHNCSSAWNGNMLQYSTGKRQILAHNLSLELAAAHEYTAQAQSIKDPLISAQLLRIAKDEEIHYNILHDLLSREQHAT